MERKCLRDSLNLWHFQIHFFEIPPKQQMHLINYTCIKIYIIYVRQKMSAA